MLTGSRMKLSWSIKLFRAAVGGCLAFVLLTAVAMAIYPGGTTENHADTHYRLLQNFFSDLGRTRMWNGQSNIACMIFFIAAMLAGAAGLSSFFIGVAAVARVSIMARFLGSLGALFGVAAAVCFVGVACTPWNHYFQIHMEFVVRAFEFLLMATGFDLMAVLADGTLPYRMIAPFAVFIGLLIAYIILLTGGPSGEPSTNMMLQAIGQKIIVYSSIAMIIVQSIQMLTILQAPPKE